MFSPCPCKQFDKFDKLLIQDSLKWMNERKWKKLKNVWKKFENVCFAKNEFVFMLLRMNLIVE